MITEKQKTQARMISLCIDNFQYSNESQEKIFEIDVNSDDGSLNEFFQYFSAIFGYDGYGNSHLNILHNNTYDKFVMTIPSSLKTILTATYSKEKLIIAVRALNVEEADEKEFPNPGLSPIHLNGKVLVPHHLFIELSQIINETPYFQTISNVIMHADRYKFITNAVTISEIDYEALVERYVMFKKEGY